MTDIPRSWQVTAEQLAEALQRAQPNAPILLSLTEPQLARMSTIAARIEGKDIAVLFNLRPRAQDTTGPVFTFVLNEPDWDVNDGEDR